MLDIYIGIDAGGTTTQFAAYTENDEKIKHVSEIGSNLMNNREEAIDTIMRGLASLVEPEWKIKKISIGMAGVVGNPLVATLKGTILQKYPTTLTIDNDVVFAHKAIFKNQPGLLLSSGTGSIAILSLDAEEYSIIGGYGHLYGDEGSGYDIAKRAIQYCMKMHDMQKSDAFTMAILEKLEVKTIREAIPNLYRSVKGDVADLAGTVAMLAENNDLIAIKILTESALSFANYICEVLKAQNIAVEQFALWGSVFTKNDLIASLIEKKMSTQFPTMKQVLVDQVEITQAVLY